VYSGAEMVQLMGCREKFLCSCSSSSSSSSSFAVLVDLHSLPATVSWLSGTAAGETATYAWLG